MRRKVMAGFALALGVAAFGCLDALAPGAPHRAARLGIVPVFEGVAAQDGGIPGDVDSILLTIHHPPAPDMVIGVSVAPGQDSIVFIIDVPMGSGVVDTVAIGLVAMRHVSGPPPRLDTLYRADSVPLVVRMGQPTRADTMPVRYVGPGRNIASIAITPASAALRPGDSTQFGFVGRDSAGGTISDMPTFWGSRDRNVAGVGALGMVRAGSEGTTWVVVTAAARGSVKDSARVVVSSTPQALIVVAPATASFTAPAGGANPTPQAVQVTAGGTGMLSVLSLGRIVYGGGQATAWLSASLNRSTAPATITLEATTAGLVPGTYTATVPVASSQAANSPQSVTATFVVTPVPAIGLSSPSVSFIDTVTTTDPAAQSVTATNVGTGTLGGLTVGMIAYGAGQPTGWLTASLGGTTAPATLTLSVAKGALAPGVYTATVPVTAAAANNSPQTVTVTFELRPMAAIGLTPQVVGFVDTMTTSDPAAQTVAVANVGTGTLSALAVGAIGYGTGPTGWLTASVGGTMAPATLTLSVAKGTLQPGVYTATVPVTSTAANNSPQTVTVTFDLRAMPLIGLAPGAVTFTDTVLTADPAAQTVVVANTGTGTLNGLAVGAINYATGSGWLTATLSQATAPATLTLRAAKGALAAGTYTATVPMTAGFAGNAPQSVVVTFVVLPPPLVSTLVLPGFFVLQPADTMRLYVLGYNATGGGAPTLGLRFTSRTPAVAGVDSLTGLVTGVAGGTAVILVSAPGASGGTVLDSALIAVPVNAQAVTFATANGSSYGAAKVGDTVRVLVGVDISAVSGERLGSYAAQLNWASGVMRYVSTEAVPYVGLATPVPDETNVGSGQLLFSASNAAGTSGPVIGLAYVKFVATSAGASPLTLVLTNLTAATTLANLLPAARVVSGSLQVR